MSRTPEIARVRILLAGVGGQGILTAARILGDAAVLAGVAVAVGQLHGMSQRGGSMEASVVLHPGHGHFIGPGAADVVLGLEPLETLRALPRISARTTVLANRGRIVPYTLSLAGEGYPDVDGIFEKLRAAAGRFVVVDGPALLRGVGDDRCLNVLLLGALAGLDLLPFDADVLWRTVERDTPERRHDANRRAFALGREAAGRAPAPRAATPGGDMK